LTIDEQARLCLGKSSVVILFLALTFLATTACASEIVSEVALPDAPSAVLTQRFSGLAEDASRTSPFPSGSAPSDEPDSQAATRRPSLFHRALQDQKQIYTAPFRRRNVKWDLLFLIATGGLIVSDKHISGALSHDHTDISQHISDVGMYSMTASVAGLWLSSLKTKDAHARETGILAAEAFANTAAVLSLTQLIADANAPPRALETAVSGRTTHSGVLSLPRIPVSPGQQPAWLRTSIPSRGWSGWLMARLQPSR
jgi:hypothetical protein